MSPQESTSRQGLSNDERADDLREPLLSESENEVGASPAITVSSTRGNDASDSGGRSKDIVLRKFWKRHDSGDNDTMIRVNHNVFLNLLLAVLYGISNSLWSGTAYVAYLKRMGHGSNGPVGDIEAVSGLASLLCALPIGYLADKMGRSIVIRAGGILLFVTATFQIGILEWVGTDFDEDDLGDTNKNNVALISMGAIMIFWGLGDGVVNGPCQALFADSTPEGERSTYFTYQFACYLTASAVGPLVSIIMFQTLGDEWDMGHLRLVIYVGLGMEVFNSLLMMLFDDNKALDTSDDNAGIEENESDNSSEVITSDSSDLEDGSSYSLSRTPLQKRQEWIPYLVFVSNLISALGSGMTVKFFPLFFKDEVHMTPSQVQIIYCLVPLVMVVLSTISTKIANAGVGRVQTTALYTSGGISLLLCMVFFKSHLDAHPFYLVPIYLFRTGLINANYPLCESILMDYVPKDQRARWKSLDSVASFGWCGSAAFGGWIADKYDYTHTFLLTAIFQFISLIVWCCLLPLVPRVEGGRTTSQEYPVEEQGDVSIDNESGVEEETITELSEPLL